MTCQLLKIEELTIRRQSNLDSYDDDGFPSAEQTEEFTFDANVQPVSGHEVLQMPEGDRDRQILNVFSEKFEIKKDDIVIRDGVEFEVRTVENWNQLDLAHFFARIVRKDV